jgi:thymidylate kinase
MNKLIIIEGPQGSGKTFLLSSIDKEIFYSKIPTIKYKFPMAEYLEDLNISNRDIINGMAIGRDLTVIEYFKKSKMNNIILDRGFLSTIVWGILTNLSNEYFFHTYIDYINNLIKNISVYIIFISGESPFIRNRLDGFDNKISYKDQHKVYLNCMSLIDCNKISFGNSFDDKSIKDFQCLIRSILD